MSPGLLTIALRLPLIWADLARMQDQTCARVPGRRGGTYLGYLDRAKPASFSYRAGMAVNRERGRVPTTPF